MSGQLTLSQKAKLFSAASIVALTLSSASLAQMPSSGHRSAAEPVDFTPGNRIDTSQAYRLPSGPNTEREGVEFDQLGASKVTSQSLETVAASPVQSRLIKLEDHPDNATFVSGQAILLPSAKASLSQLATTRKK